ncbi:CHAD domain-containing protein [Rhizobium sp. KVB221]|uniref:CHAD domain-containing protein n=1 Tax=Rhizobium setariae TaxID=2801340 RepID=A0A936YNN5_9HYPH|nr:CHAD domain-containing protein [Rhizobium setariae]MBL0372032.1 CHAD domain-containing protein [Rhizobium setariae]
MAYRINFKHPFQREVRSIASEQLAIAIDFLEEQPDGPHEAIHKARRRIKRTRALYRLCAQGAKGFARTETERLGKIAGRLAHLRDAAALTETVEYIKTEIDEPSIQMAFDKLGSVLTRRRDQMMIDEVRISDAISDAVINLQQARNALADLNLPERNTKVADCLATGWRSTGSKAMEALIDCADNQEGAAYHELRKRGQDRWMHAALLRRLWPSAMQAIRIETEALISHLGHEHDLAMLSAHLAETNDLEESHAEKDILLLAVFEQRQRLQKTCREAAELVFDDRPERDAARIRLLVREM